MDGQLKILLVEDNEKLRTIYVQFLQGAGFTPRIAADGEEAMNVARDYKPDLIFLDIMLPKKNGLDVLQALRHDPSYGCTKTKIVLLTNLGDASKYSPTVQQDIDGYAMKSEITLESLLDIIRSFKDFAHVV